MKYVIGIDLGTCNSAVSYINSSGKSEIIKNDRGESLTPSVINFENVADKMIKHIGTTALRVLDDEPETTCAKFKTYMGTGKNWNICGESYDSTELSTFLLEKLKNDALAELKRSDTEAEIACAIITVPARFSQSARAETKNAGILAGLKVKALLDEPTAALLYYQHSLQGKSDINGIYAIVDLGGGTLDISMVRVKGQEFSIICATGSLGIGGINFDRKLAQLVRNKFAELSDSGITEFTLSQSEDLKKILSDKESHSIRLSGKIPVTNKSIRHRITITRSEFEENIQDLIEQIGSKCLEAMEQSSIAPAAVRGVILVGGSARVPAVKRKIDEIFESNSSRSADCDEAVARGAGIYATSVSMSSNAEIPFTKEQKNAIGNISINEVLHKSYGVVVKNDKKNCEEVAHVLISGTEIPCEKEEEFYLTKRDINNNKSSKTREVKWQIVESENKNQDINSASNRIIRIETLKISSEKSSIDGKRELTARFRCDCNKVLHCEFVDKITGLKSASSPIPLEESSHLL